MLCKHDGPNIIDQAFVAHRLLRAEERPPEPEVSRHLVHNFFRTCVEVFVTLKLAAACGVAAAALANMPGRNEHRVLVNCVHQACLSPFDFATG